MRHVCKCVWMVMLSASAAVPVHGEPIPLRAELDDLVSPLLRSGAPGLLVWKLQYDGDRLIEGHLRMVLRDDQREMVVCQSPDLALSRGERAVRLGLPDLGAALHYAGQLTAHLQLVTGEGAIDLGRHTVPQALAEQSQSICICIGNERIESRWEDEMSRRLAFMDLVRDQVAEQAATSLPQTSVVRWQPIDLSASPLEYCVFDLVTMTPNGFLQARASSLETLAAWIRAGGRLCIACGGQVDVRHATYLNELMSSDDRYHFSVDSAGKLLCVGPTVDTTRMIKANVGLGRVVVLLPQEDTSELTDADWGAAAMFLWVGRKISREENLPGLTAHHLPWSSAARYQQQFMDSSMLHGFGSEESSEVVANFSNVLLDLLMPRDVRLVPVGWLALLMVAFVLLIGPVDYLLLGWLRLRQFTWITFPAITLGITCACVALSNRYLSSQTGGRYVTIRDVDDRGKVVRQNRFDIIFSSRPRMIVVDVRDGIYSHVEHGLQQAMYAGGPYGYMESPQLRRATEPIQYSGRMPIDYQIRRHVRQWDPQMYRTMEFPTDAEAPPFPWQDMTLVRAEDRIDELRSALYQHFGERIYAMVLYRNKKTLIVGSDIFHVADSERDRGPYPPRLSYQLSSRQREESVLCHLSRQAKLGDLFFVSRIPPRAGSDLQDLSLLDAGNSRQCLLVVAVPEERGIVIYRRLYEELIP